MLKQFVQKLNGSRALSSLPRRTAALAVGTIAVASPLISSGTAHAMSPNAKNEADVTYLLSGSLKGGVNNFWATTFAAWGRSYSRPGVYFYNGYGSGDYNTACGHTANLHNNAFYCSASNSIYIDYKWSNGLIASRGDFSAGGILAHEWGHRIQHVLGYRNSTFRQEYHADCLAGMYTRYGYAKGRLVGSDYYEIRNWLKSRAFSVSHGIGSDRAAWFDYGYSQYDINKCNLTYFIPHQLWEGSAAASDAPDPHTPQMVV